uniref:Putative extracellular protein TR9_086 n=1 Tax=Trebouxia lynnae TaxID=1825957 RepID=A0A7L9QEQ6_9CHLO|nr:putative extracellular protein TR9_086 [Trebouxia lynnae]
MRCLLFVISLVLCLKSSIALSPYQGTGRNCVPSVNGSNGPTCKAPKLGLCCDASQTSQNCLTPSKGTKCAANSGFGPGPVKAYCCDAMDLPGCEAFSDPTQCPGDSNPYYCASTGTVPTVIDGKQATGGLNCTDASNNQRDTRNQGYCC